jgi:DNA polymerase-3 subunit delta
MALVRDSDPELASNAIRLSSSDTDWPRLADELYTAPFFAKRKLVVVVDDGNFVHNNADRIKEYLKQPSPSGVLVALVPTEKIPALGGEARVVECRTPRPAELSRWIVSEAQRLGKQIDRAAAELLGQRAGGSLLGLAGHLEKLALHAGARSAITAEDVRSMVGNEEAREVYELSLASASKDLPRAYRILRALLAAGEAVQVLLWKLSWQYRKLAEAKKLLLAGRRRFEVTSQLQITYYAEEFLRLVDGHTIGELVSKHGEILKADLALKTSGGNELAIIESLICKLAVAGPQSSVPGPRSSAPSVAG